MDAKGKGKMVRVEPEASDVEPEISDDSFDRMLSEASDLSQPFQQTLSIHNQKHQPHHPNLLGNSIGIQKTSSQGSNSSKRSNVK